MSLCVVHHNASRTLTHAPESMESCYDGNDAGSLGKFDEGFSEQLKGGNHLPREQALDTLNKKLDLSI